MGSHSGRRLRLSTFSFRKPNGLHSAASRPATCSRKSVDREGRFVGDEVVPAFVFARPSARTFGYAAGNQLAYYYYRRYVILSRLEFTLNAISAGCFDDDHLPFIRTSVLCRWCEPTAVIREIIRPVRVFVSRVLPRPLSPSRFGPRSHTAASTGRGH